NVLLIVTLLLSLIIPSSILAYDIEGDPENPTLTIYKLEQDSHDTNDDGENNQDGNGLPGQNAEGEPLPDVEFTLTQTHQYDSDADEWTEVEGTPVTHVTDGDGKIVIEGIDLGRYKVQETDGPPHVNLNTEEYFVDIPMTNESGSMLNYDVHIYPKNETI